MSQQKVTALVGAQFGSEGKGLVAAALADQYPIHVRTGAPNAGHTYYDEHRVKVVARSIPCGAINRSALLVIGAGAFIDLDLLLEEVAFLDARGWNVTERLFVDPKAALVDPIRHHQLEGGVRGRAHELIGSTGEGVGPARMAKLARGTFSGDLAWSRLEHAGDERPAGIFRQAGIKLVDTAQMLNQLYDDGSSILLEGTQGSGLSVTHGPWPYVTSCDTNAGQLAVDAGLAPGLVNDVILVARTFPIRVAGRSGPLPKETSWEAIGERPEYTTVTKKERRVGMFHEATVRRAVMLNRPSGIALTFLDYNFPADRGCDAWEDLSREAREFVAGLEVSLGVWVLHVGTGPRTLVRNTGADRDLSDRFLGSQVPLTVPTDWPSFVEAYTEVES